MTILPRISASFFGLKYYQSKPIFLFLEDRWPIWQIARDIVLRKMVGEYPEPKAALGANLQAALPLGAFVLDHLLGKSREPFKLHEKLNPKDSLYATGISPIFYRLATHRYCSLEIAANYLKHVSQYRPH